MLRFVDLGNQVMPGQMMFAWYDTVRDCFISLDGNQAWESWKDFEEDLLVISPWYGQLNRFWNLAPRKIKDAS